MQTKQKMSTKTLACCALLAALNVVLARFCSLMPSESARFSIEAVPVFLSGMLFGPLAGGLVGFTSDFVGCFFSPYPYNPIFCIPSILYGVFGGVFRKFLTHRMSVLNLMLALLPPIVLGSVLYQSAALTAMYFNGNFFKGFVYYLSTRSVQFSVVLALDTAILYLLMRSGIFVRLKLWPAERNDKQCKRSNHYGCNTSD